MSVHVARTSAEAVRRLRCRDSTLHCIDLSTKKYTDEELVELMDCLLSYPNNVTHLKLSSNRLTDITGVKLAHYVAASTTIKRLYLYGNQFSDTTYLAMANALCFNISLEWLCLYIEIKDQIEVALINALMINPHRSIDSFWSTPSTPHCGLENFGRLKAKAEQLGHPNMQALLATKLIGQTLF